MVDKVNQGMMSQSEYARSRKDRGLVGGTTAAVNKAIKEGRIKAYNGLVDPEQADLQWARNTRVRATSITASSASAAPQSPAAPRADDGSAAGPLDYMTEKTRLAAAQAGIAELELAQKRGELTDTKIVREATITAFRTLRDMLQGVGRTLAPKVAKIDDTHEITLIVNAQIRAVLDVFVNRTLPDALAKQAPTADVQGVANDL